MKPVIFDAAQMMLPFLKVAPSQQKRCHGKNVLMGIATLASLGLVPTESCAEVVDVFFLAGQSNASGRVKTGYTPDARDAMTEYYYYTDAADSSGTIYTSNDTFTTLGPLSTGFYGSEISMGRRLVDLNYNPAIIKVSKGGTSMIGSWRSDYPEIQTGTSDWWWNWYNETKKALKVITDRGDTVNLRGFFWMQGESDTSDNRPASYQGLFDLFTHDVVKALDGMGYDASHLKFVTGLIHAYRPDPNDAQHVANNEAVRSAQRAVMDSWGERGAWFDTSDLSTLTPTDLHYDQAGVKALGERFADGFNNVPEPGSLSLILCGLALLNVRKRRRR